MGTALSAKQIRAYILHAHRFGVLHIVRLLLARNVYPRYVAEVIEGYRKQALAG